MYNLLSGLIGILISVMLAFNGVLSKNLGSYTSIVVIHLVGLLCIGPLIIIKKAKLRIDRNISIYLYSAGAIGVFTVLFNNLSFNHLGAALTLSLGLLGQSIASIIIDNYGLLGSKVLKLRKEKFIGLFIIVIGIVVMTLF